VANKGPNAGQENNKENGGVRCISSNAQVEGHLKKYKESKGGRDGKTGGVDEVQCHCGKNHQLNGLLA
jgi:hypothetical protein